MKQFVLLALSLITFSSCSLDEDLNNTTATEFVGISDVIIPEEFVFGEIYEITLDYDLPTDCHSFQNIYYSKNANERTVAIVTNVANSTNCLDTIITQTTSFNFEVTQTEGYVFKFWQNVDDSGEDNFLTFEIPVID